MDQRHDGAVGADDHHAGEEDDVQPVFDYLCVNESVLRHLWITEYALYYLYVN